MQRARRYWCSVHSEAVGSFQASFLTSPCQTRRGIEEFGLLPHWFSPSPLGENFGSKLLAFRANWADFANSSAEMTVRSGSERCDFIQQNIGVQNGVGGHVWHANRLESICMAAWGQPNKHFLALSRTPSFNQSAQNPSFALAISAGSPGPYVIGAIAMTGSLYAGLALAGISSFLSAIFVLL